MRARVLFGKPQCEIASLLRDNYERCKSATLLSGFMTPEGIRSIVDPMRRDPSKLNAIIAGSGTYKSFESFDSLLSAGVKKSKIRLHLGYSRPTSAESAVHSFYRYHPMIHSKVYLFDFSDGSSRAIIGSHNLTGFALMGLNGEASVEIEGASNDSEFHDVRAHIDAVMSETIEYDQSMKDAYGWWATSFIDGLRHKVDDAPRLGEAKRTIVIISAASKIKPKKNDVVYFEVPEILGRIRTLNAEVHLFVFQSLPPTPSDALNNLSKSSSFWCKTVGLEDDQGGAELKADWQIVGSHNPDLVKTRKPFRPVASAGMQQVRAEVVNSVFGEFEYIFGLHKKEWEPIFDKERAISPSAENNQRLDEMKFIPPEAGEWMLVRELRMIDDVAENKSFQAALKELSPESGSYILLSTRRVKR